MKKSGIKAGIKDTKRKAIRPGSSVVQKSSATMRIATLECAEPVLRNPADSGGKKLCRPGI